MSRQGLTLTHFVSNNSVSPGSIFIFTYSLHHYPDERNPSPQPWKPNKEMSMAQLQAECRLWDVNEVVFRPDVWPTFEPLLRADFSLFDQYTHGPEGKGDEGNEAMAECLSACRG